MHVNMRFGNVCMQAVLPAWRDVTVGLRHWETEEVLGSSPNLPRSVSFRHSRGIAASQAHGKAGIFVAKAFAVVKDSDSEVVVGDCEDGNAGCPGGYRLVNDAGNGASEGTADVSQTPDKDARFGRHDGSVLAVGPGFRKVWHMSSQ